MLPARARNPLTRSWLVAGAVLAAFLGTGAAIDLSRGLVRTVHARGEQLDSRETSSFDLGDLRTGLAGRSDVVIAWRGAWETRAGVYDLALESRGHSTWTIDGELAQKTQGNRTVRTVWLAAGFHRVEIVYTPDTPEPSISVLAAPGGGDLQSIGSWRLKPRAPRNPGLRAAALSLWRILGLILIVVTAVAIRRSVPSVEAWWRSRMTSAGIAVPVRRRAGRIAAWTCLAGILVYGALLRVDLITVRYGPVSSPRWLAAIQTRTVLSPPSIRPGHFPWVPADTYVHQDGPPSHYISDPYTYLDAARKMSSFYAAHYREPLFPFAVRMMLHVLDNQDVAISFTSAAFSLLAVWLTYLLGAAIWSRPVGVLAALGLAIDHQVIDHSTLGWREDAFMASVLLATYALLRCWRAARAPVRLVRFGRHSIDALLLEGIALGVVAGLAVLMRFWALSFLLPAGLLIVVGMRAAWTRRLAFAGLALAVMIAVSAGYFVNCWRVYGDPFYTFNIHGNVYRVATGQAQSSQESTASFITDKFASRPLAMIDTVSRGLTTYPFDNKWGGLSRWKPGLGSLIAWLALAGVALLATLASGRLVLAAGFTSLIPFAFTSRIDPNWRFTEHVYPLLLIGAAVCVSLLARAARLALVPGGSIHGLISSPGESSPLTLKSVLQTLVAVASVGLLAIWMMERVLPPLVAAEALAAREDVTIAAGEAGTAFFSRGWLDGIAGAGNVRFRVSGGESAVSLTLPEVSEYRAILRIDPFPRPLEVPSRLPVVDFMLNGKLLAAETIAWNQERVGAYEIALPREIVRKGSNELVIRPQSAAPGRPGLTDGAAYGLWLVRLHLPGAAAGSGR